MKADGFAFTVNTQQAGKADKLAGNLVNIASYEFDAAAAAAVLDPQKANDDRYYRIYRQVSTGPYSITSESGVRMRIDGFTIDDVGVRPSRLQLPALLAMIPPAGAAPPTPAQARAMMENVARLYEGVRVGNAEMRGIAMETPQGQSSSRRYGSTWKTARSANLRSKAWMLALRKGPSRSDASRLNRSISPTCCDCRRCTQTRRNSPRPIRLSGCSCCSTVPRSRTSSRPIRIATS